MRVFLLLVCVGVSVAQWCQPCSFGEHGGIVELDDILTTPANVGRVVIRALLPYEGDDGPLINSTDFAYDPTVAYNDTTLVSFIDADDYEPKSALLGLIKEGLDAISAGDWFEPALEWTTGTRPVNIVPYIKELSLFCRPPTANESTFFNMDTIVYASLSLLYIDDRTEDRAAYSTVNISLPLVPACSVEDDDPLAYVFTWNRQILFEEVSAPTLDPHVSSFFGNLSYLETPGFLTTNWTKTPLNTANCAVSSVSPLVKNLTDYLTREYYNFSTTPAIPRFSYDATCGTTGILKPTNLAKAGGLVTVSAVTPNGVTSAIEEIYPDFVASHTTTHVNITSYTDVFSISFTIVLQYLLADPVYQFVIDTKTMIFTQYNGTAYALSEAVDSDPVGAWENVTGWTDVDCVGTAPIFAGCHHGFNYSALYERPATTGINGGETCTPIEYVDCPDTIGNFTATFTPESIAEGLAVFDKVTLTGVAHILHIVLMDYADDHGVQATVVLEHLAPSVSKQWVVNYTYYSIYKINGSIYGVDEKGSMDALPTSVLTNWDNVNCVPTQQYEADCTSLNINKLHQFTAYYVLSTVTGAANGTKCAEPVYKACFKHKTTDPKELTSSIIMTVVTSFTFFVSLAVLSL